MHVLLFRTLATGRLIDCIEGGRVMGSYYDISDEGAESNVYGEYFRKELPTW